YGRAADRQGPCRAPQGRAGLRCPGSLIAPTAGKKRGRTEARPKSREETPEKGMRQTRRLAAMHNLLPVPRSCKRKSREKLSHHDFSDLHHILTLSAGLPDIFVRGRIIVR